MGTISRAKASWGLTASGALSSTRATGNIDLGESGSAGYPDADIFFSFVVTSTSVGDEATLDWTDCSVSQTTGTPTITDADGNDFSGDDLPTMVTLYAVQASTPTTNGDFVTVSTPAEFDTTRDISMRLNPGKFGLAEPYVDITSEDLLIKIEESGNSVTLTVVGKST